MRKCLQDSRFYIVHKSSPIANLDWRNAGEGQLREIEMTIFGYARVSTEDQTLDNQIAALTAAGAVKIFSEKESGAKTDREALARAIAVLDKGDLLLVTRLDRLARSMLDLLNTLEEVSKRKAGFRSLAEPWADTTTAHGKLMLTILGGLAEFERSLILSRCNEGRVRAMANGVQFGRKHKLTAHQKGEAMQRRQAGETLQDIAKSYNVSHQTIGRL